MKKSRTPLTTGAIPGPHGQWERRAVAQALYYWRTLRGERTLPSIVDLPLGSEEIAKGEGLWPHLFIATVPLDINESVVTYCGSVLAEACGAGLEGKRAADCLPPSLWDRMRYIFQASATWQKPLLVSGPFVTWRGTGAVHRSIVMPVGDGEPKVQNLLGGFSFKHTEP